MNNDKKTKKESKNYLNYIANNAIKSIGYISVVISLGLTIIVSLICFVTIRNNYEWTYVSSVMVLIFGLMLLFLIISIAVIYLVFFLFGKRKQKTLKFFSN